MCQVLDKYGRNKNYNDNAIKRFLLEAVDSLGYRHSRFFGNTEREYLGIKGQV